MCLAVPGKIVSIQGESGARMGKVDFQGSRLEASLLFTPEAEVSDWVLVHAGFAIRRLEEREAVETWKYLREADLVELTPGETSMNARRTAR